MGDFSRDPGARLQDSVAKHYVGVRLQQGVPILDADWNELEDLRRHEVASLFQRFFGDGVPDGGDGFRVEALGGGGAGTLVLQAGTVPAGGVSSLAIDFGLSTAASVLGFLPADGDTSRPASTPARLAGNAAQPFALADGLTFAVSTNGAAAEQVTFAAADFANIAAATAAEVAAVLNAGMGLVTAQAGAGNDFRVRGGDGTLAGAGRLLVEGVEAVAERGVAYASQPLYANAVLAAAWGVPQVAPLTTPVAARTDLVYVDVWDREVDTGEDDGFVVPAVGIEASVRLRREWAVRVAEGASLLAAVPRLPGHRYGALARLSRAAGQAAIGTGAVADLRVRSLNVARYLKTPIHVVQGADELGAEDYAALLDALRDILLLRLHDRVFPFQYTDEYDRMLVLGAVRDVAQQAAFGAIQARAGTFNNDDGFRFLRTLYDLQSALVDTIADHGNVADAAQDFVEGYGDRLDGAGGIPGLLPALEEDDFLAAVEAQEAINAWLASPVDALPEGDIVISIMSVSPGGTLTVNAPFTVTYRIQSLMTSPQAQETVNLVLETAAASTWTLSLNTQQLTLNAMNGEATVTATVTPRAGTASTILRLRATAARNPAIIEEHLSQVFTVNQAPPETFLQFASALDPQGRFAMSRSTHLADGSHFFEAQLVNTTGASRTFRLSHFVTPPGGQTWAPLVGAPSVTEVTVAAGATETSMLTIDTPVSPPQGSSGTITLRAQVIAQGGAPVADGAQQTVNVPFIVTA